MKGTGCKSKKEEAQKCILLSQVLKKYKMMRNPPPSLMHQIQPRPSEYIRILAEAGCIS
jgi:hypothetical protein